MFLKKKSVPTIMSILEPLYLICVGKYQHPLWDVGTLFEVIKLFHYFSLHWIANIIVDIAFSLSINIGKTIKLLFKSTRVNHYFYFYIYCYLILSDEYIYCVNIHCQDLEFVGVHCYCTLLLGVP